MAENIFTDQRKVWDKQISQIETMGNSYVRVGFQEGSVTKTARKGAETRKGGESMPAIAAKNEYGIGVPARPFLRPAIDENQEKINRFIAVQYVNVLNNASTVKKALETIGLFTQDLVVGKIDSIFTPPNSKATIMRKGSSKPLIDFGQMRQAVTYKVVIA